MQRPARCKLYGTGAGGCLNTGMTMHPKKGLAPGQLAPGMGDATVTSAFTLAQPGCCGNLAMSYWTGDPLSFSPPHNYILKYTRFQVKISSKVTQETQGF